MDFAFSTSGLSVARSSCSRPPTTRKASSLKPTSTRGPSTRAVVARTAFWRLPLRHGRTSPAVVQAATETGSSIIRDVDRRHAGYGAGRRGRKFLGSLLDLHWRQAVPLLGVRFHQQSQS